MLEGKENYNDLLKNAKSIISQIDSYGDNLVLAGKVNVETLQEINNLLIKWNMLGSEFVNSVIMDWSAEQIVCFYWKLFAFSER